MGNQMIFVNLPVADVARAKAFWEQVGFRTDPQFTDENAVCVVFSDTICAMLLARDFYRTFTHKAIADGDTSEVLIALSAESRERVDALVERAVAAGGKEARDPMEQGDYMYSRAFDDPDHHTWEAFWMDAAAAS